MADSDSVRSLNLRHPAGLTEVIVGRGALTACSGLGPWVRDRTVFTVTTPRVWALHGEALEKSLAGARRNLVLEVPEGEEAKSLEVAAGLWPRMLDEGGKRDSRVVTFGGGSVGDLGGFVAGCFLRGIEFTQVPTTLLAQVDAAIGGKTGVDLPNGKNTVGLFHQPKFVISEAAVLETLPRDEIRAALAEVVKVAVILDPALLERVERDLERLLAGEPEALGPVVVGAARCKIDVVQRDPHEKDERRLLNLGHTLGHALEANLGYRGLRHGDAVSYGLLFALRLSCRRGLDPALAERMRRLLERFGLPALPTMPAEGLLSAMAKDKKAQEKGLTWVLVDRLGRGKTSADVTPTEVAAELDRFLEAPWAPFA